jgi:hypothetical protein
MHEQTPIYGKLQMLRRQAQQLARAGFPDLAVELMRAARGEVKIKTGQKLFGLTPRDIDNASSCVTWERHRWAASHVLSRKQLESEDEVWGGQGWPKGRKKSDVIAEVAQEYGLSEASLRRFMASKECPSAPETGHGLSITDIHPDWHPDNDKELYEKG